MTKFLDGLIGEEKDKQRQEPEAPEVTENEALQNIFDNIEKPEPKRQRVQRTFTLRPHTNDSLDKLAKAKGISQNEFINQLIDQMAKLLK